MSMLKGPRRVIIVGRGEIQLGRDEELCGTCRGMGVVLSGCALPGGYHGKYSCPDCEGEGKKSTLLVESCGGYRG